MFTHAEVWRGIDQLARSQNLTASGLARRAGLDPTTFNPSKRITNQSKPRWPSTESLAKILTATETRFSTFVTMMGEAPASAAPSRQQLPCLPIECAEGPEVFDRAGFPVGDAWDAIDFPNHSDQHAYALEVKGDAMAPIYRDGDLLIVSPEAQIRRHDRVLLKTAAQSVLLGQLLRRTAQRLELDIFGQAATANLAVKDVAWLARIVWVSQ